MMLPNQLMSRRTVLRGLGTAVALPVLDAMLPRLAVAGTAKPPQFPARLAVVYVPNGKHMQDWIPKQEGPLGELPKILRPLESFKDDILVLSGLTCDKARPNGDGTGDHARAMAAFLTGCQPKKTAGADIRVGVSFDQIAAKLLGTDTRFRSLEIGCEGGRTSGNCDSGYSCAYNSTVSWQTPTTPLPKETNPQLLFDRLFGKGPAGDQEAGRAKRQLYRKSILDLVNDDAKRLHGVLGSNDRRKLDEYLSAVRELEQRVTRGPKSSDTPPPDYKLPTKTVTRDPSDYPLHLKLMADLLVLALQTDQTRVATFVFANESSQKTYPFIGVPEGHHDLSHHGNDPHKIDKIRKINTFHTEQFAYLLGKMKDVAEGESTLLDNCAIVYGSGNADGNRHAHHDLPILVAGRGRGTLKPGRHVRYPVETPLTNLYVSLLERYGSSVDQVGDSTGKLKGLS